MTSAEYIKLALRTESNVYPFEGTNGVTPRIEHGTVGLVTESAEMMDAIKKAKYYNKPFDRINMLEEMGDCFWYLALLCDELGVTFEEIMEKNIAKLRVRYPEGYSTKKSDDRDPIAERQVLSEI